MCIRDRVDTALSFMVPEILAIPENTLQSFQKQEKGLALYAFLLAELMRQKPHVLSGPEEEIIARAGEIAQSPDNIFRMINHADLQRCV